MFKKLALSAIAIFTICSLPKALAQTSSCSNYWVNPSTGKEECLNGHSLPSQAQAVSQEQKEANGSVKVFEGQNGDRAYIRLNSIRKFARYCQNRVHFSLTTFYEHIKVGGSAKANAIYNADCNSYSMRLDTFYTYDANNQIVDGISYGSTSNGRYQTTAPSPVQPVQPNTLGYAAWKYVCGKN